MYDIGRVTSGGNANILARQISDFNILSLKFSPFEERKLISCGKENVRFWRIADGRLAGYWFLCILSISMFNIKVDINMLLVFTF